MTFKACAQADIFNTFLSADEFAEWHEVDDRRMLIMPDTDRMTKRNDRMGAIDDGVYFYAAACDFPRRPVVGGTMVYDRRVYAIAECLENDGVYEIRLVAVV